MPAQGSFNFRRFSSRAWDLLKGHAIFFNASAITFNLLITSIPFTLILFSLLGYILSIDAAYEQILRFARELLPITETGLINIESLLQPLIGSRQLFGIVGLVVLTIFAQGLIQSLKHVLFSILQVQERRHPFKENLHNFLAFGVVGGLFVFFGLLVYLISWLAGREWTIPNTDIVIRLGGMLELLTIVIPIVFTFTLIFILFRVGSEQRMSVRTSLIGSGIYSILFEIARLLTGSYLGYAFTRYQYYYKGYTLIIILGFWAFYAAVIYILSAILAKAFEEETQAREWDGDGIPSPGPSSHGPSSHGAETSVAVASAVTSSSGPSESGASAANPSA